ncbi:formylglycine-generating enzyme family protein [Janthinobacterium fluminis]|uniref:Formylglycine-generating enzyme family protein n=1 Tax=Janthinobacterium fluminis TaxID=2987524 RepID=A0ABT5JYD4_9BURK|nr:formylglycine-generating enzyme family protein [Janthinobacterium fluminis]MDC8757061.1 formylglycine-generating enzyme family protein [Janthinobacterium fluminis]
MTSHPICAAALAATLLLPALPAVAGADYVPIAGGTFISVLSGGNSANSQTDPAPAAGSATSGAGEKAASAANSVNGPVDVAPFALRTAPVSNGEFIAFLQKHPEWRRGAAPAIFTDASYLNQLDTDPAAAEQPITSVSWFAAQAYCASENARLPSWYEWEYVAAADTEHADARRNPAWRAAILKWYAQSSSTSRPTVGGKPNFYGVRDMHGLIWEWVDDFNALLVSADSRTQGDPEQLQFCGAGAISLQDRENYAILMRIALLSALNGADTTSSLGFRCARNLTKE